MGRGQVNPRQGDPIPETYLGEAAVLLATGPSLSVDQIDYIRPFHEAGIVRVFGLGDAYKICDFMDVFYGCDPKWFSNNMASLDGPCPEKWTQDLRFVQQQKGKGILRVYGTSGRGLCKDKNRIHFGSNSGFQLLNLAWQYGIRTHLLLGYTMDVPKGMQQHFFGRHPKGLNQSNNYKSFVPVYRQIDAADRRCIINCTYPTALDSFKQIPLQEALPQRLLESSKQEWRKHFDELKPAAAPAVSTPGAKPAVRIQRDRVRRRQNPRQKAATKPTVPRTRNQANLSRQNRRAGGHRSVTDVQATRATTPITYGGPGPSLHDQ